MFRNAIVLDADGYVAPVFSADGRFLAVRGNAYVQSVDVFEFPTLRRVLHSALGDTYPGYPYPPEWLEEQATWSRHNITFVRSGALLVGTPQGTILEIDLDDHQVADHYIGDADVNAAAARARAEQFLSTTALPEEPDLLTDLLRTDGVRGWDAADRSSVDTADETDPTWLQLQAAINSHRANRT